MTRLARAASISSLVTDGKVDFGSTSIWFCYTAPPLATSARARHGIQLVADEPVLQCAKFAQVMPKSCPPPATVYQNTRPTAVASGPSGGTTPGHLFADQIQPLQHSRAGEVEIDIVLKDREDHREAKSGTRTHHTHARKPCRLTVSG